MRISGSKRPIGFVDIHHHILYGIDDGAKSLEEADAMLAMAYEDGTRHIVATSHYNPSGHCPDIETAKLQVNQLNAICQAKYPGLSVSLGAELFFGDGSIRKLHKGAIPTMNGTSNVLVEFQTRISEELFEEAIRHLSNGGYTVIVAHTERYGEIFGNVKLMQYFKDKYRILYQCNAEVFLDKQSFFFNRKMNKVIQAGLIDFVASDAHSTEWRRTRLGQCYEIISSKYGEDLARFLMRDSAMHHLEIAL